MLICVLGVVGGDRNLFVRKRLGNTVVDPDNVWSFLFQKYFLALTTSGTYQLDQYQHKLNTAPKLCC